jgi:tRNA A37 methylthiotransferase MiaB/very-short-patch-repair endonuclease
MAEVLQKEVDEARQGEAYAPFAGDPNVFNKKFYIESYGCAMNFSDSEIIASILHGEGFGATKDFENADLVLLNTCSIRDKAEQTVRNRLQAFRNIKKRNPGMLIGVLGCMAERLKAKLLDEEKLVDIVIGPDAYRSLPDLISEAEGGQKSVNVLLSREETYADISPVRLDSNGITAFVSIMRGCNNMCSFCVVPFTRGRERSRDAQSILAECRDLFERGYKEVTLLGQNVDSYYYSPTPALPQGEGGVAQALRDEKISALHGYMTGDETIYGLLKAFQKKNKDNPTKAETILWDSLRGKQLEGYKFRRQHIILNYIADFICLSKHLIIEVDGSIHQLPENQESDKIRTENLNRVGFEVLRFTNDEVINGLENVLEKIEAKLKSLPDKPLWFKDEPLENEGKASPLGGGLEGAITFAKLLEQVALISPTLRVRFSTSHPKDITDEVLYTMAKYHNICKNIHLPVQSGNTRILQLMNRTYTREWYLNKVRRIREIMPDCGLSTDVISGFCTETEEDHQDTLSLMEVCRFDMAYMYSYSERPGTLAERRYTDDVPEEVKKRRLEEIISMKGKTSHENYQQDIGKTYEVLIEATSKKSEQDWSGRNTQNKVVIFPKAGKDLKKGDYVNVKIMKATSATLMGEMV